MGPPPPRRRNVRTDLGLVNECTSRKADNLPHCCNRPSCLADAGHCAPTEGMQQPSMTRRGSTGSRRPKTQQSTTPGADWRGEDPNLEFEKSRYADPIASRELLLKHLAEAPEPL